MSVRSKVGKFRALLPSERWSLLLAMAALPLVAVGLRVVRLDRLLAELDRLARRHRSRNTTGPDALAQGRRTYLLVSLAARHGLYRGNCLSRSLTLWWLLRRQGIDGDLRIGVRREASRLEAHAWVECGGHVLGDAQARRQQLVPFDRPILPGGLRFS